MEGRYEPVPIETVREGILQGYSSVLNLFIRWEHRQLGWHKPETGNHIFRYEDLGARVCELETELERCLHRRYEVLNDSDRRAEYDRGR